jgi:two-component system chemotaxis response regulator CheY
MKTVLLVDDSPTILLSLSALLTQAGYGSVQAAGAEQALAILRATKPPDLVITDLNMPGMNGIELIRTIRKLPGFRFVPVLMLTTESQAEKRAEARSAGATGWLVKPVQGTELVKVLEKVVQR